MRAKNSTPFSITVFVRPLVVLPAIMHINDRARTQGLAFELY
jgi:hypothetical protein